MLPARGSLRQASDLSKLVSHCLLGWARRWCAQNFGETCPEAVSATGSSPSMAQPRSGSPPPAAVRCWAGFASLPRSRPLVVRSLTALAFAKG